MQRPGVWLLANLGLSTALVLEVAPAVIPLTPPRNGVFCRGNGCQYGEVGSIGGQRVLGHASSEQDAEQQAQAALAMGMDVLLARKEFCRGMSCVDGMGKPLDRSKAIFLAQCAHFFAGNLEGQDEYRSVKNVYDSFGSLCGPRVGHAEMPFCRAYGDVIAAALASQIDATVGSAEQICDRIFDFTLEIKQAQIDLQLFEGSLKSLGEEGPDSVRGKRWAKSVQLSSPKPLNETHGDLIALSAEGQTPEKYEVTMPSWDQALNGTTVLPALFEHCEVEMREVMLNESQTAGRVSKMAVDWCNFQLQGGDRPDWTERSCIGIGKLFALALRNIPDPPPGGNSPIVASDSLLPEPIFGQLSPTMPPTYTMMPTMPDPPGAQPTSGPAPATMSKEQMQRIFDPLQRFLMRPDQVCQQVFVAIGASYRVEGLLQNSYKTSFRIPTAGMALPTKDDAMLQAMQQAADFRKTATKVPAKESKPAPSMVQAEELPQASDYHPKVFGILSRDV